MAVNNIHNLEEERRGTVMHTIFGKTVTIIFVFLSGSVFSFKKRPKKSLTNFGFQCRFVLRSSKTVNLIRF